MLLATAVGCDPPLSSHSPLSAHERQFTSQLIARPIGQTFTLRSVTDFAWDSVWVFGPYAGADIVGAAVGARVDVAHGNSDYESMDTSHLDLLVFKRDKFVVAAFEINPLEVDLQQIARCRFLPSDPFVKRKAPDGRVVLVSGPGSSDDRCR